jgi:hypothetical protein
MVKVLVVDGGAKLNDFTTKKISPLFLLLPHLDERTLSWMIDGGYVDVDEKNWSGDSLFSKMLETGSFKMIQFYLTKYSPNQAVEDEDERWREFSLVANRTVNTKDNLDAARWLVKNSFIDLENKRPLDGRTPLMVACRGVFSMDRPFFQELILKLIEVGEAKIDVCDNDTVSCWESILPMWQRTERESQEERENATRILKAFLSRSAPPQHVEIALLATKNYRDLVPHGRAVRKALAVRRKLLPDFMGNRFEKSKGLSNDVVNIVLKFEGDNMSTEEMWAMM